MIVLLKSASKKIGNNSFARFRDFYSQVYIDKWEQIISQNKDKFFMPIQKV